MFTFWLLIAFEVRLVTLLASHLYSVSAGFGGFYPLASGADDRFYYAAALSMIYGERVGALPNVYPIFLAWVFYIFGPSLLLGKLINAFLGALGVAFGVLLVERLCPWPGHAWSLRRPAHLAGIFLSFYPSAVFYSTQLLKDGAIWALGLALLYWGIVFLQKPSARWLLVVAVASSLLWFLRPYTVIAFWIALVLPLAVLRHPRLLIGFVVVAIAVPWAMGFGPLGLGYLGPLLNPERLSQFREQVYGVGGSSLGLVLDPARPLAFALGWMYSFVTVLLGPFPWQINSLLEAVALGEALVMWLLAIFWLPGVMRLLSRPSLAEIPLFFGLVLAGGVALFSDNIGANTRLRLLIWASLMVYAALRIGGRHAHSLSHHPR
ncbi:hypothetical protein [Thermus antranikianii]